MEDINEFKVLLNNEPEKRVGEQMGHYRLIRWLGKGAFADVYLGEHVHLKTQNAIKMLHVQLSEQDGKDFLNEACTIARLDHPHIVRVLDYGLENGIPFLVMEYAPNGSSRQRFPEGTRVPLEQIVPLVQQIASALDYAHQQSLIHGDIKPENILVGAQDQALLADFGLAVVPQSIYTQTANAIVGTVLYMAPEQLKGKVGFASDQYALGIMIYEWLCGTCPFTGSYMQIGIHHVLTPPPSLRERVPDLPAAVEHVVFKALAKDQTQRYENVTAFANALQDACQNTLSIDDSNLTPQQPPSPSSETPLAPEETSFVPEKMLTSSPPIKSIQLSRYPGPIWQIVLLAVAIIAVLATSARLWYTISSSRAWTYYTAPAIGKNHPASIVEAGSPTTINPTSKASQGTSPLSPTAPVNYEAESVWNTLAGGASVLKCFNCSGGEKVGYIGWDWSTHTVGTLQFNNIYKNIGGKYRMTIYYLLAGADTPTMYMSVNGGPAMGFAVPVTANAKAVGTFNITVSLNAGNNTIEFSNPAINAPDIDRIVV